MNHLHSSSFQSNALDHLFNIFMYYVVTNVFHLLMTKEFKLCFLNRLSGGSVCSLNSASKFPQKSTSQDILITLIKSKYFRPLKSQRHVWHREKRWWRHTSPLVQQLRLRNKMQVLEHPFLARNDRFGPNLLEQWELVYFYSILCSSKLDVKTVTCVLQIFLSDLVSAEICFIYPAAIV